MCTSQRECCILQKVCKEEKICDYVLPATPRGSTSAILLDLAIYLLKDVMLQWQNKPHAYFIKSASTICDLSWKITAFTKQFRYWLDCLNNWFILVYINKFNIWRQQKSSNLYLENLWNNMTPNTRRVGFISWKVGYNILKVGQCYQNSWHQVPGMLAPMATRGTWRDNKTVHGGGQNCNNLFKTNAFLFTTASTICPEKTPQVGTSPLSLKFEENPSSGRLDNPL